MRPADEVPQAVELAAERAALVSTLKAVGPRAATLVDRWTAQDLAAHLAATEQVHGLPTFVGRTLVARYGLRLNDLFRPVMAVDLRRFRRHGFEWALRRLERPVPRLLSRRSVLPVSVFEVFVHHEDVRRANGMQRDEPPMDLVPSIAWLLRYHRRLLGDLAIRVMLPDGRDLHSGGDGETVTVHGSPSEVLLWLAGRDEAAAVSVEQPETGRGIPFRPTV